MPDETSQDDVPTLLPQGKRKKPQKLIVGPAVTQVCEQAIERQSGAMGSLSSFIGATLSAEFRDQDVVIEGVVMVAINIRERATGVRLGGAEESVTIPVNQKHQGPTDTEQLEVQPFGHGSAIDGD